MRNGQRLEIRVVDVVVDFHTDRIQRLFFLLLGLEHELAPAFYSTRCHVIKYCGVAMRRKTNTTNKHSLSGLTPPTFTHRGKDGTHSLTPNILIIGTFAGKLLI